MVNDKQSQLSTILLKMNCVNQATPEGRKQWDDLDRHRRELDPSIPETKTFKVPGKAIIIHSTRRIVCER